MIPLVKEIFNKSEIEVLQAIRGLRPYQSLNRKGTNTYKVRISNAINSLKARGIIYKNEMNVLKEYYSV